MGLAESSVARAGLNLEAPRASAAAARGKLELPSALRSKGSPPERSPREAVSCSTQSSSPGVEQTVPARQLLHRSPPRPANAWTALPAPARLCSPEASARELTVPSTEPAPRRTRQVATAPAIRESLAMAKAALGYLQELHAQLAVAAAAEEPLDGSCRVESRNRRSSTSSVDDGPALREKENAALSA